MRVSPIQCVLNLVLFPWVLSASELIIPPFDEVDLAYPPSGAVLDDLDLPQLRLVSGSDDYVERNRAFSALLQADDQKTIQRLVFALRQGNEVSEHLLLENARLSMVPYLLEDVARGSIKHYSSGFRVREAATEIMMKALAITPGFPDETRQWFKSISVYYALFAVPERSKFLIDWWIHNEQTVMAGKLSEATWLPKERELKTKIFDEWDEFSRTKTPPPPPPPPVPSNEPYDPLPIKIAEPFKDWVRRVSHPEGRDLTWFTVDFETRMSIPPDQVMSYKLGSQKTAPLTQNTTYEIKNHRLSIAAIEHGSSLKESASEGLTVLLWLLVVVAALGGLWMLLREGTC